MLRIASVSVFVGSEDWVSTVQRILSVGVMDGLSLAGVLVSVCATVLLLAASVGLFVPGRIVLVFLFLLALSHRWCKKAS